MCRYSGCTEKKDVKTHESCAGGSESLKVGLMNKVEEFRLMPYYSEETSAATIFAGRNCLGSSHVVWFKEGYNSSWDLHT